jgi:Family of unknown function (DUF6535)
LYADSGVQTVVLLGQISQQLGGFTNGTFPLPPASQQSSHPSIAIVAVNAMWLMSLVLSISSALFATLLQQWARRYIETPQTPTLASQRARVRSFLFLGIQEYHMSFAIQTVPALLHLSVFLFFAGIVVFFFTIHKAVAIAVSVSVGVFAVMYGILTVLPYFGDKCPYRTPMSDICWYPWHVFLAVAAICLRKILKSIHTCLVPDNLGQAQEMTPTQRKLVKWSKISKDAFKKHRDRLQRGFRKSIIKGALDAPVAVDRDALTRLFKELALVDESELRQFVAIIPRDKFLHIMTPPIESKDIVFRESLTVIRNRIVDKGAKGPNDNEHGSCLLVWLAAIHHVANEFLVPNRVPETELGDLLDVVLINFADTRCMQALWAHDDTAVRVISRSICALLAKCLLQNRQPGETELPWLEAVTGVPRDDIFESLHIHGKLDRVILTSFVCGVFPHLADGDLPYQANDPPTAHASSIAKTLATLMDAGTEPDFSAKLLGLIRHMEGGETRARFAATKLHQMFSKITDPPAIPPRPPVPASPQLPIVQP